MEELVMHIQAYISEKDVRMRSSGLECLFRALLEESFYVVWSSMNYFNRWQVSVRELRSL